VNTRRKRYLKRTDLFLVRVWTEEATAPVDANHADNDRSRSDGAGQGEWSGSVQRVVDGEVHRFDSLQALTSLLLDMLSGPKETL